MIKKNYLILPFILVSITASTQSVQNNKISYEIGIGSGVHTLLYSPFIGQKSHGYSGSLHAQVNYQISKSFQLTAGVSLSHYYCHALIDTTLTERNKRLHGAFFSGVLYTKFNQWTERQSLISFGIPIELFYTHNFTSQLGIKIGAGIQLDLPLKMWYKAVSGSFDRTLYIPETGILYENLENHHLGHYTAEAKGDIHHDQIGVSTMFDMGVELDLNKSVPIYVGVYCTYGIIPTTESSSAMPFENYVYCGMMNSVVTPPSHTFQLGVKISYRFGKKKVYIIPPVEFPSQTDHTLLEETKQKAMERYNENNDKDAPTISNDEREKILLEIKKEAQERYRNSSND